MCVKTITGESTLYVDKNKPDKRDSHVTIDAIIQTIAVEYLHAGTRGELWNIPKHLLGVKCTVVAIEHSDVDTKWCNHRKV